MASEVQDCCSPEANCLPTGSISFGRFESESLTWERRSSFSHNRYLEEVEKYSTPGSVIKKKAYFEAHFKKTALRNLDLFATQNETDGQAENDMQGQDNCVKEFRDSVNEELSFEDLEDQEIQFSWYDETPDVSDEEQHETMETEKQNEALSSVEVANINVDAHGPVPKTDLELVQHDESVSSLPGCDMAEKNKDGGDMIVEEKSESTRENVNAKKMDASTKSSVVKKVHASNLKKTSKASHMAKSTTEQKSRKVKSGISASAAQMKRKISTENNCISAGLSSGKDCKKVEKGKPVRPKQPSSKISSSTYSAPQKSEDPDKMKVKARTERSDKGEKTKGVLVSSTTSHQQGQLNVHRLTDRDKRVTSTMKLNIKNGGAVFSFKSEERAEKRKEYFTKLEEKHHTKEVEMNEIQAKEQEETEAAMKQFRKSLNFKATPMPSFYQGAGPKASDRQKAISGPTKSTKMQGQHTTSGNRSTARSNSPSLSKSSNSGRPATGEHPSTTHPESLAKSGGDSSDPTEINGAGKSEVNVASKQTSQPDRKIDPGKREDRTKSNVQQQQGASKMKKKGGVNNNVGRSGMGKVIKGMAAESMVVRVAS